MRSMNYLSWVYRLLYTSLFHDEIPFDETFTYFCENISEDARKKENGKEDSYIYRIFLESIDLCRKYLIFVIL